MFLLLYRGKHGLKRISFDNFPNGIDLHPYSRVSAIRGRKLIDRLPLFCEGNEVEVSILVCLDVNDYGDEKSNHRGSNN